MCLCGLVMVGSDRVSVDVQLFRHLNEARRDGEEMAAGTYAMCPVVGCPWSMELTRADEAIELIGWGYGSVDEMVAAAAAAAVRRDDQRALRHVESGHSVVEFLQTIAQLRDAVQRLQRVSGVR